MAGDLSREEVEELEALLAEATPGPWRVHGIDQFYSALTHVVWPHPGTKKWTDATSVTRALLVSEGGRPISELENDARLDQAIGQAQANAKLIAAAINALPALLTLARSAPSEEELALREAAVAWVEAERLAENPGDSIDDAIDRKWDEADAEADFQEAARAFARTVEKTNA